MSNVPKEWPGLRSNQNPSWVQYPSDWSTVISQLDIFGSCTEYSVRSSLYDMQGTLYMSYTVYGVYHHTGCALNA